MSGILKRLLGALAVWLGVATLAFALTYVIPADPAKTLAGAQADAATVENIRRELGLDAPLAVQYGRYMGGVVRGDFGTSYVTGSSVMPMILERLPATAALALGAVGVYGVIGMGLGLWGGLKPRGAGDKLGVVIAAGGVSVPSFWFGLALLYVFAYQFPILPLGGYGTPLHLILPALTLGIGGAAYYIRLLRQSMQDVMRQDFIRTARAKGLPETQVITRHALRNASLPIVTLLGVDVAHLLGGAVLTESVFGWPGIGSQAMQAIATMDVPVIMGTVLFAATVIVAVNLIVDVVTLWLDPRVASL
jgi:peptide/nickel transport system permease protein